MDNMSILNIIKKYCSQSNNKAVINESVFTYNNKINAGLILYFATRSNAKRYYSQYQLDESISKRNMVTIDKFLSQNTNFGSKQIAAFKTYVSDRTGIEQLAMAKWIGNGSMKFPEDIPEFEKAIHIGKANKIDVLQYNSISSILQKFRTNTYQNTSNIHVTIEDYPDIFAIDAKYLNGDLVVYAVEDSKRGQQAVRDLMNDQLTINGHYYNCWCLLFANEKTGKLTKDSWTYWKDYSDLTKKIALYKGVITAFSASDECYSDNPDDEEWWDLNDQNHGEYIPITIPIKNDELNRSAIHEFDPRHPQEELVPTGNFFRGNKKNGVYQEWDADGNLVVTAHYRHGDLHGKYEEYYYDDGQDIIIANYKNGNLDGIYKKIHNNVVVIEGQCKDGSECGKWKFYSNTGKLEVVQEVITALYSIKYIYNVSTGNLMAKYFVRNNQIDGIKITYYNNGKPHYEIEYKDGIPYIGIYKIYYPNGQIKVNGQFQSTSSRPTGKWTGYDEQGKIVEFCTFNKYGEIDKNKPHQELPDNLRIESDSFFNERETVG